MVLDVDAAEAELLRTIDSHPPEVALLALLQQHTAAPAGSVRQATAHEVVAAKLRARSAVAALERLLRAGAVRLAVVDHWDPHGAEPRRHALAPTMRTADRQVALEPVVARAPAAAAPRRRVMPRLVPAYLLAQALLVASWWLALWLVPAWRAPFVTGDWPEGTLLAFALPDVVVLVFGSLAAALGLRARRPWGRPAVWLVAGAVLYATLWCLGANAATGAGWLSTAMMLACCAAMTVVVAVVR